MNVRKRGLALLMCICMIFTLLPFSALADATTQDVVYGKYDSTGTTWKKDNSLTAENDAYKNDKTGANIKYSKEAKPVAGEADTYDITLKIESTTTKTSPGASAVVLVIDQSYSMNCCATCNNDEHNYNFVYQHAVGCKTGHTGKVYYEDTRLKAAKDAAKQFADNYAATGSERYLSVVSFCEYSKYLNFGNYFNVIYWVDVSNEKDLKTFKDKIDTIKLDSGTNLSAGLDKAYNLFNNDTVKNISSRYTVVLTDGEPNYPDNSAKAAEDSADNLKTKAKSEVYTVCVGAEDTPFDGSTVGEFLKEKIASKKTGKVYAYNIITKEQLFAAFTAIFADIQLGISSGFTVTDPMGKYVNLDSASLNGNGYSVSGSTITWEPKNGTTVDNPDGSGKTTTYTLTYKVTLGEVPKDGTYPLNENTTLKFKDGKNADGSDNNVTLQFNVPGVKGKAPTYTVTYKPGDHGTLNGADDNGNVVTGNLKYGDDTPMAPIVNAYDGYYFKGWEPERAATVTGNAVYTAKYAEKYEITVVANSGEVFYNGNEQSITGLKQTEFTFNGKVYTVSGLSASVSGTDADEYTNAVTGTAVVTDAYGKDVTNQFTVNTQDGTLKIKPIEITLKSASDQKQYDGTPLTNSNVTVTKGAFVDGEGYTANVTGSQTLIGSSENTFTYTLKEGTKAQNYDITTEKGTLQVIDRTEKYEITVIAKSGEATYDGKEHSVSGFEKTEFTIDGNTYTVSGLSAIVSGIDADEYPNVVTGTAVVKDANGNDVTDQFTVKTQDGSLTITKRPLTIIGESSDPLEITYDGKTHEYIKWSLSPATDNSGLVSGHQITGITYLLTGKNAGEYTGKFSGDAKIMSGEEDVTANYSIKRAPGMMKIIPAEKIAVKIIGNHKEVWYNGQEQSVSGFTFEVADNTVTVELKAGHYAIAKGTNVKTYYMGLKSDDFTINHQNYKEVSVEIADGYLTIKRHYTPNPPIMDEITVEITGNSDSVVYDGTEHSVKGYTVKISDPRYTEKDFTFTGKAEASGVNAGTYEMGLKAEQFKNINARFTNVKFVIKADGVLTITPKELTITAGSKTEYGPTPVTCNEWTVSGLAAGDKVESVKITGIQSVPGSSPNVPSDAVIKNAKGEDVTKNYAIKYVNGTLTMLEVLNKEDHFNYIIGTPEGLSLPTANVTRAEVATIFFRLMTDDARAKFDSLDNSFSDVAKGKWYNRAISTLAKAGIIKGDPAGTYRPGDPITRAEMAAIIARFGDFKEGGKTFSDISGHWAQKYIELAASNGWINGNPDGTFKPNNKITRAETVAMINRVLNRQTESNDDLLPVSQMTNWSDNMDTAKWYYRDMQEATNNHKAERVGDSMYEKWTEKLPDIDWASYQI